MVLSLRRNNSQKAVQLHQQGRMSTKEAGALHKATSLLSSMSKGSDLDASYLEARLLVTSTFDRLSTELQAVGQDTPQGENIQGLRDSLQPMLDKILELENSNPATQPQVDKKPEEEPQSTGSTRRNRRRSAFDSLERTVNRQRTRFVALSTQQQFKALVGTENSAKRQKLLKAMIHKFTQKTGVDQDIIMSKLQALKEHFSSVKAEDVSLESGSMIKANLQDFLADVKAVSQDVSDFNLRFDLMKLSGEIHPEPVQAQPKEEVVQTPPQPENVQEEHTVDFGVPEDFDPSAVLHKPDKPSISASQVDAMNSARNPARTNLNRQQAADILTGDAVLTEGTARHLHNCEFESKGVDYSVQYVVRQRTGGSSTDAALSLKIANFDKVFRVSYQRLELDGDSDQDPIVYTFSKGAGQTPEVMTFKSVDELVQHVAPQLSKKGEAALKRSKFNSVGHAPVTHKPIQKRASLVAEMELSAGRPDSAGNSEPRSLFSKDDAEAYLAGKKPDADGVPAHVIRSSPDDKIRIVSFVVQTREGEKIYHLPFRTRKHKETQEVLSFHAVLPGAKRGSAVSKQGAETMQDLLRQVEGFNPKLFDWPKVTP